MLKGPRDQHMAGAERTSYFRKRRIRYTQVRDFPNYTAIKCMKFTPYLSAHIFAQIYISWPNLCWRKYAFSVHFLLQCSENGHQLALPLLFRDLNLSPLILPFPSSSSRTVLLTGKESRQHVCGPPNSSEKQRSRRATNLLFQPSLQFVTLNFPAWETVACVR